MTMQRWSPFGDMLSLRDAMNRLLEESYVLSSTQGAPSGQMGMPLDVRETQDDYILEASLPGVQPDNVDVTVQGNQVTVTGERQQNEEKQGERWHVRERRYGRFQRTVVLPTDVQSDKATCEFNNGILTVTLPKAEETKPRRIPVKGEAQGKQIEGRQGQGQQGQGHQSREQGSKG